MNQLKTASVLAFERNLDISDAVFFQTSKGEDLSEKTDITPVVIREKSIRGTISNRLKNAIANDPIKLDAEVEKANLQTVDVAALNHENNVLIAQWSCKVLPFTGKPIVCNDQDYQEKLTQIVEGYLQENQLTELSKRYATNIVNGRWLWRNRIGAEKIKIQVEARVSGQDETININDAKQYNLNTFPSDDAKINRLAELIEKGLMGENFIIFDITAELQVGYGQEVYPSQELILETGSNKSKVLYDVNGKAGMHSQKIGNGIRTIDDWYDDAEFPIAVEPYGSVTTMGAAFRQPKNKQDFYSLFDNWVIKDKVPALDQQHYVIAILIRGGVFGASGKE